MQCTYSCDMSLFYDLFHILKAVLSGRAQQFGYPKSLNGSFENFKIILLCSCPKH